MVPVCTVKPLASALGLGHLPGDTPGGRAMLALMLSGSWKRLLSPLLPAVGLLWALWGGPGSELLGQGMRLSE